MIEQYGVFCLRRFTHKPRNTITTGMRTVIATYYRQLTAHDNAAVAQQRDARLTEELLSIGNAGIIFMIARTGIYRRLDASELRRHILLAQRFHAAVDYVARNEHHVRRRRIYHVHPPRKLLHRIVIAYVHIAQHHNPHRRRQWPRCVQLHSAHLFVAIVSVGIDKERADKQQNAHTPCHTMVKKRRRHEPDKTTYVEKKKNHD